MNICLFKAKFRVFYLMPKNNTTNDSSPFVANKNVTHTSRVIDNMDTMMQFLAKSEVSQSFSTTVFFLVSKAMIVYTDVCWLLNFR